MGFVGQLITLILAGYFFTIVCNLGRYWLMRKQGYELLFVPLLIGWFIQQATDVCLSVLQYFLEACGVAFPSVEASQAVKENAFATSIMVIAMLLAGAINLRYDRRKAAKLVASVAGDLIEYTLQKAVEKSHIVALDMDSGKSYIGFPLHSGIDTLGESDVSILPIMSGYRDRKTQDLKFTVNYVDVLDKSFQEGLTPEHFLVILPKSRILSTRRFNIDVYTQQFGGQIANRGKLTPGR